MDMDQAAVFLAGTILTALGFIVVVIAAVIVNNILHKYWKPVQFFLVDAFHANSGKQFVDTIPQDDKSKEPHLNTK